MKYILSLSFLFTVTIAYAQIVTTNPVFPKATDQVTITYDATQGTGQLAGLPQGTPVYLHTGMTTQNGQWQFVVGNWGTDDDRVEMTRIPNTDLYQFTYTPTLIDWYDENNNDNASIPGTTEVTELGMVFRNVDGSLEGKTEDWQDIFIPIYSDDSDLLTKFVTPTDNFITNAGNEVDVFAAASIDADLTLLDNGNVLTQAFGDSLTFSFSPSVGDHELVIIAEEDNMSVSDTIFFVVNPPLNVEEPPAGTEPGINIIDDNSIRLSLFAPGKDYVYVIGDFNDWKPQTAFYMNRSNDGATWWLDITGLDPDTEYAFQYFVDGTIKIGEPYSEKILDPFNDQFIPASTYPNLKPYPQGKTSGIVTAFTINKPNFNWQHDDYERPANEDLVIYELLIRDFITAQNYQTLIDTLDYLDRLGINALELMPINEFEGNISWGYNPSYHMALDKYYGTPEDLKTLVDACHERGIAVIVDIVLNHGFSQCPLAQLYWNPSEGKPAPDNPWFNVDPTHAFNVGSDFNHESPATEVYVERIVRYWLEEYHIDGYRFDLSKGFTQNENGDFGAGAYDASRIAILKNIADICWDVNPEAYVTLEHFTDNTEEKELADYGMMLWGNMNFQYNEATMGYNSNLDGAAYTKRGWDVPHLISYMESHDEERIMYKNLEFGNSGANGYDVTDLFTALQRVELGAAFFYTIPGPKMLWQFGEAGYDYSIFTCPDGTVNEGDDGCKLSPKPIRWDYPDDPSRRQLYDVHKALIDLKTTYPVFSTTDFDLLINQSAWKRINLNHPEMNVSVLGNFDVNERDVTADFQHDGWWYEYFSGDSINVTNVEMQLSFAPGEYRLFTDVNIGKADVALKVHTPESALEEVALFPNPTSNNSQLTVFLSQAKEANVQVFDVLGKTQKVIFEGTMGSGYQTFELSGFSPGIYQVTITLEGEVPYTTKWVVGN